MKKRIRAVVSMILFLLMGSASHAQFHLFDEPRSGGFKITPHNGFDATNVQHFAGSGLMALGIYKILWAGDSPYPKFHAALVTTALGLLKEIEDGFREGFDLRDALFNQLGISVFFIFSEQADFVLTLEHHVLSAEEVALGFRFFQTPEFGPLSTSFGFYAYRSNRGSTRVGINTHFRINGRAKFHFGASLFDFRSISRIRVVPGGGMAFKLL